MAFKIKHGDPGAIAELGILAGKAQKRQREEAQAFEVAMRIQDIQSRIKVARFDAQLRAEAQKRDMAFELQKIQINKQNTFAMQEELRIQKMQAESDKQAQKEREYEALLKSIDDDDRVSEEQKARFRLNVEAKFRMGPSAPQIAAPRAGTDLISQLRAAGAVPEETPSYTATPEEWLQAAAEGKVIVRDKKTGELEAMTHDKLQYPLTMGDVEIIESPLLGKEEEQPWWMRPAGGKSFREDEKRFLPKGIFKGGRFKEKGEGFFY